MFMSCNSFPFSLVLIVPKNREQERGKARTGSTHGGQVSLDKAWEKQWAVKVARWLPLDLCPPIRSTCSGLLYR